MHMGDLAGAGHFPTISMVVRVANGAYFDAPGILFFYRLKAERATVFYCTRKPDFCASFFGVGNFRFARTYLDRFLRKPGPYLRPG